MKIQSIGRGWTSTEITPRVWGLVPKRCIKMVPGGQNNTLIILGWSTPGDPPKVRVIGYVWIIVDMYIYIFMYMDYVRPIAATYCETYAWLIYAVRWHVEWYIIFHVYVLVCRPPKKFPTVGTSDSYPMWLTLMTMFPINPDFPCTPSTIAALGSLPFGRPLCCGWVSWKEKMKQVWKGIPAFQPHLGPEQHLCSWIWSTLRFFVFFGIMGMVAIIHSLQQGKVDLHCMVKGATVACDFDWSPGHRRYILRPGVGWPNMLRFKMILVKQPKYDREKLHGSVILQKKKVLKQGKQEPGKEPGVQRKRHAPCLHKSRVLS